MPLVTVVTPLLNKAAYVSETLQSVVAQHGVDWEMVVVDNGSTDGGPELVRRINDPRVRVITTSQRGPGAARNAGVQLSTSEWVIFLDADDLLEPSYLLERTTCGATSRAQIVAGCWQEFHDANAAARTHFVPAGLGGSASDVATSAIATAPWPVHAAVIRRSWLMRGHLWPEELDDLPSEDVAFWFRALCGAELRWSRSAGALYRRATPQNRDALADADRRTRALLRIVDSNVEYLRRLGREPSVAQCATIVRVLERCAFGTAASRVHPATCEFAQRAASKFLTLATRNSGGMRLRRLLGLQLFNRLRRLHS